MVSARKRRVLLIWKNIQRRSSLLDRNKAFELVVLHVKNQRIGSIDLVDSLVEKVLRPIVFAPGGKGVLSAAATKQLIDRHILEYGQVGGEPLADGIEDQTVMEAENQAIVDVNVPVVRKIDNQLVVEMEGAANIENERLSTTQADLDAYFDRIQDHLRMWTLLSLMEQLKGSAATLEPSSLSRSITLLQDILQWCQEGRLAHAIKVAKLWWVPVDVMAILERGLLLYKHRFTGECDRRSLLCHEMASLMSAEVHKRYALQEAYSLVALCEQEHNLQVSKHINVQNEISLELCIC